MSIKTVKFVQLKEKMPEIGSGWEQDASCLAKMKCHSSGAGGGALSAWLKTVNLLSLERHSFLKNLGDLTLNDFRTIK